MSRMIPLPNSFVFKGIGSTQKKSTNGSPKALKIENLIGTASIGLAELGPLQVFCRLGLFSLGLFMSSKSFLPQYQF